MSNKGKKAEKPSEMAEEHKPNNIARVHVDGDIRWPKSIRDQLVLQPKDRWSFSIVSVSSKEFTIKAVKVEG